MLQNVHLSFLIHLLLLSLSSRAHLFAECEVRNLKTKESLDTDKDDQEKWNDGGKSHEQSWREVLVLFEQSCLVVDGALVGRKVAFQFHLHCLAEGTLHFVGWVFRVEFGLGC